MCVDPFANSADIGSSNACIGNWKSFTSDESITFEVAPVSASTCTLVCFMAPKVVVVISDIAVVGKDKIVIVLLSNALLFSRHFVCSSHARDKEP